jgi:hypothetical protein
MWFRLTILDTEVSKNLMNLLRDLDLGTITDKCIHGTISVNVVRGIGLHAMYYDVRGVSTDIKLSTDITIINCRGV